MPTKDEQQQAFEQDAKAQELQSKVDDIVAIISLPPQPIVGDITPSMAPFVPNGLEDELFTATKALEDYKKEHYPALIEEDEEKP